MKSKKRQFFENTALTSAGFLFAILMAELLVRWMAPQHLIVFDRGIWQPDSNMVWKKQPGIHKKVNAGERNVWVTTDLNGFRVPKHMQNENVIEKANVLVLGDSFV